MIIFVNLHVNNNIIVGGGRWRRMWRLYIITGLSTCLGMPPIYKHNDNMIHNIIIININNKIYYNV